MKEEFFKQYDNQIIVPLIAAPKNFDFDKNILKK